MLGFAPGVKDAEAAANFLERGGPYAAIVCIGAVAAWLAWQLTKSQKRERTWLLKFPDFAEAQRSTIEGVTNSVEDLSRHQVTANKTLERIEGKIDR